MIEPTESEDKAELDRTPYKYLIRQHTSMLASVDNFCDEIRGQNDSGERTEKS